MKQGRLHMEAYLTVPDKHEMAEELAVVVGPRMKHDALEAPVEPLHLPKPHTDHHMHPAGRVRRVVNVVTASKALPPGEVANAVAVKMADEVFKHLAMSTFGGPLGTTSSAATQSQTVSGTSSKGKAATTATRHPKRGKRRTEYVFCSKQCVNWLFFYTLLVVLCTKI
ncbi:hypothetical protein Sjap_015337 [Stephania japonica]|uniref:Uncharacterized protein n=1 Tax=Stephania japonica TaxID=461633 RepID=A0AAP0IJD8_9MAGN